MFRSTWRMQRISTQCHTGDFYLTVLVCLGSVWWLPFALFLVERGSFGFQWKGSHNQRRDTVGGFMCENNGALGWYLLQKLAVTKNKIEENMLRGFIKSAEKKLKAWPHCRFLVFESQIEAIELSVKLSWCLCHCLCGLPTGTHTVQRQTHQVN